MAHGKHVHRLVTAATALVYNRNGYCTIEGCTAASTLTIRACPTGSTCNHGYSGGLCQKTCSLAKAPDCRNQSGDLLGDYECRDWSQLTLVSGFQLASGPVCDFGVGMPCDTFGSSGITCKDLGSPGNPTKMACRGLDGKILTDPKDPLGFCLDNTGSASASRSPLPTP
jgi:hypothetical protein